MKDLTACVVTPSINTEGFDPLGIGVHRASTIVFKDAEAYATRGQRGHQGYSYGLYGTPTTRTLEHKLTELEQGVRTFLAPSGQSANALAVLPFVAAGDKVLIADTAYPPMRDFADRDLKRLGVEVDYYNPVSVDDLEGRIDARTKIVWCESPGSTTMEVQDLPRIAELAHRHSALVGFDNTWATPLNFKPLVHGADVVTEGLTKYVSGHSDVLMGSITVKDEALIDPVRLMLGRFGIGVSPDDASLVLRGFETLGVRMRHSSEMAMRSMAWIGTQATVAQVLHPSVDGTPGKEFWTRDALGCSGVFGVRFRDDAAEHVTEALNEFKLFAIGASWGGTRSLVAPMPVRQFRTATSWQGNDLVLRISIGLEDIDELQADLQRFFDGLTRRMQEVQPSPAGRSQLHAV